MLHVALWTADSHSPDERIPFSFETLNWTLTQTSLIHSQLLHLTSPTSILIVCIYLHLRLQPKFWMFHVSSTCTTYRHTDPAHWLWFNLTNNTVECKLQNVCYTFLYTITHSISHINSQELCSQTMSKCEAKFHICKATDETVFVHVNISGFEATNLKLSQQTTPLRSVRDWN